MVMNKRFLQKALLMFLTVVCAVTYSLRLPRASANAMIDDSTALRFKVYNARNPVPDGTLFIGTWLISLEGLTDEYFEMADASASDAEQTDMYYKSEMAPGSWFNYEDIQALSDLTPTGPAIPVEDLDNLFVQYYVGPDGRTIDVVRNKEINPFNRIDPYDLKKLPELEGLWIQYTYDNKKPGISQAEFLEQRNAEQKDEIRSSVYYHQLLTTFFSLNLRDEETNRLDEQVERLYACYKTLKDTGEDSEADLIFELAASVDASRRCIVLAKLADLDNNALMEMHKMAQGDYYTASGSFKNAAVALAEEIAKQLRNGVPAQQLMQNKPPQWLTDLRNFVNHDATGKSLTGTLGFSTGDWWSILEGEDDDEEDETKSGLAVDNAIIDAISGAIESCKESYDNYAAKQLVDNDSVLGHAIYTYSNEVIAGASAAGLSAPTLNLRYTRDIRDGIVLHADEELALLESKLLPEAWQKYTGALTEGSVPEGRTGGAAAQSALEKQKTALETKRNELQFLITAKKKRIAADVMYAEYFRRIDDTEAKKPGIKTDPFANKAKQSANDHIAWLKQEAAKLKNEDKSLASALDKMQEEKEELQEDYQDCLDNNDLKGAEDIRAKMTALDERIAEETTRLANLAKNGQGGLKAMAAVDLGNSMDAVADSLLDTAKALISEGAFGAGGAGEGGGAAAGEGALSDCIDALAAMGATDALEEIKDALSEAGAPASVTNKVDKAIEESRNTNSLLSGAGALSEDLLRQILEGIFGSLDDLDERSLAVVVAALSRLAEDGNVPAGTLARSLAQRGADTGNRYIYEKYSMDLTRRYIPANVIGRLTSYRYVYSNTKQRATLTKGAGTYAFTTGSDVVVHGNTQAVMSAPAVFEGALHICEEDAITLFSLRTQYVPDSIFAVCLDALMYEECLELYDRLLAAVRGSAWDASETDWRQQWEDGISGK